MPFLFLSPSTQEGNPYVTEGNERLWMNRIADEMEPYLRASGVPQRPGGDGRHVYPRLERRKL